MRDRILNLVKEIAFQGWPEATRDVPVNIRSYWSFPDELAVVAGILFKGQHVMIPESMREELLHQLHQGIKKSR